MLAPPAPEKEMSWPLIEGSLAAIDNGLCAPGTPEPAAGLAAATSDADGDRESVGEGKRVDLGGRRILKKKKKKSPRVVAGGRREAERTAARLRRAAQEAWRVRRPCQAGTRHQVAGRLRRQCRSARLRYLS